MLTKEEIFDALDYSTLSGGPQSFVLAFARAIEAAVLAKLPHEDLLRAAAYLAAQDGDMPAAEADRIAKILRDLAAAGKLVVR